MSVKIFCDVQGCTETTTNQFEFIHWGWSGLGDDFYFCRPHAEHIGTQVLKYLTRVRDMGLKMSSDFNSSKEQNNA